MRFALACLLLVGCDQLWNLDHLREPKVDAGGDSAADTLVSDGPGDGQIPVCPDGEYTFQPQTGTAYKIVAMAVIWQDARTACKSANGGWFTHLAVIKDQAEYTVLWDMLPVQSNKPWVGAFDPVLNLTNEFRWVTEEPNTILVWEPSQPDQLNVQACAYMDVPNGMDNQACNMFHAYICECDGYPDI